MLVTSIFYFSHNVLKSSLFQGRQKSALYRKDLSPIEVVVWIAFILKMSKILSGTYSLCLKAEYSILTEASIRTLSFIFAKPYLVTPSTSPWVKKKNITVIITGSS